MIRYLKDDLNAAMVRDPAAKNRLQVVLFYPGFQAMIFHRVAHSLQRRGWFWLPQLFAWMGRFISGIEIHPAAKIGKGMFIDHGMGVVIGATAEIGDDVTIYHGVTLGGRGFDRLGKRHPTIGNRVLLGAGATILGPISIEDDAKVGAGSVVLENVPAGATAVGTPAKVLGRTGRSGGKKAVGGQCVPLEDD